MSRIRLIHFLSLMSIAILALNVQIAGAQDGSSTCTIADLVKQAREIPADHLPPIGVPAGLNFRNLLRGPDNSPLPADQYNKVTVSSGQQDLLIWGIVNCGFTSIVVGIEGTTIQKVVPVISTGLAWPEGNFLADISTDLPPGHYYLMIGGVRIFIITKL